MIKIMKHKFVKFFLVAVAGVFLIYVFFPKDRDENITRTQQPEPVTEIKEERQKQEEPVEEPEEDPVIKDKYPAGQTPDEAWKNLVRAWGEGHRASNLGVYTGMAKIILKHDNEKIPEYMTEPYKILQRGDYAVVFFENTKHPPFFFCKTPEGWKFDEVRRRRIIRQSGSVWGVEKYVSPYSPLLRKLRLYYGTDIPLEENDVYRISGDEEFAEQIKELELLYKSGKMDYEKGLLLARLYSINSMGLKAIPILGQLREKMPENSGVYKYLAISYVDSAYDHDAAYGQMEKYLELVPESEFGHNFLGYLSLRSENYTQAEAEFKKALEINPGSCYAYAKLARLYKITGNKKGFDDMFKKTGQTCTGYDYERVIWLILMVYGGN